MKRSLYRFLRRRGATHSEIDNAVNGGYLALLVLDREVMPGAREFTTAQLVAQADTDLETAHTVWRAIGFPELPDDLAVFTAADVKALKALINRTKSGSIFNWTLERALPQVRVLSSSLARAADTETDELARSVAMAREAGFDDEQQAVLIAERFAFDEIAGLIDHAHRLQLRAAIWRRLAGADPSTPGTVTGAVGFVDLVGYTALSQELESEDIGALVARFGELAHDTVVDAGSMLSREGDYYGPVVNLASRLTEIARPGEVLASRQLTDGIARTAGVRTSRSTTRRIRDIGRVEVIRLTRVR